MRVARVTGRVWNEREADDLAHMRLVSVRIRGLDVDEVAVDLIDSRAGNHVLVAADEAAQAAVGGRAAGIDLAVVSLIAGADAIKFDQDP